ncbi:hypothetical protein K505DRAFT_255029 [Melanomma pulvis-pyrius CBS 109.77]|uniref:Zn(2)-C6 fungal-type domain-containing protein n=1 Tax=Melanomma pulvis-pyrius CBS 109.77 TaxID=1314802 RepID=A0A6A6WX32_9PLEO|nr:hypothetical protein K505DRAFT_255029 [Melanomma pulvis-pyrius CBS 109.77]
MARLGSKKSRNGCQQCKARRVKCDENRPCGNCSKYHVECSLLSANASPGRQPRTPSIGESSSTTPGPSNDISASPDPAARARAPSSSYAPTSAPLDDVTGSWMQDLELMHHYTAHAYLTMPGVEQAKQVWGYAVPQEAFNHSFLMHSILAFSAYHLAFINPARGAQYRVLASTHQTAAINRLNQVLPDVNAGNCHALFAGASLITLNTFADAGTYTLDALVEIFGLLKGLDFILSSTEPLIVRGPFAVLLQPLPDPPKAPAPLSAVLEELKAWCAPGGSPSSCPGDVLEAAVALRDTLEFVVDRSSHADLRASMLWPIRIEPHFLETLQSRRSDPAVSALFFKYCRILESAAIKWWFLSGWQSISQEIHSLYSSESPAASFSSWHGDSPATPSEMQTS